MGSAKSTGRFLISSKFWQPPANRAGESLRAAEFLHSTVVLRLLDPFEVVGLLSRKQPTEPIGPTVVTKMSFPARAIFYRI